MRDQSRREFLQKSLAVGAIAAAPAVRSRTPLKMSIMSYAFHGLLRDGMIDMFGYLESSRHRYDMDAVHLWSGYFLSLEDEYLAKVKSAMAERELHPGDLAVDGPHLWVDDEETREAHYAKAMEWLNAAKTLDVRFVRIDAGGDGDAKTWTDEQFDYIASRFREYAQFAGDHGFKVGAENHWGPERTWSEYQRLSLAVDHPAFGLSCHIGAWDGTEEEIRTADRECAPWVTSTHIDWSVSTGPDLEEKLANLWNAGYDGYYSVEHHSAKDEYREVEIQLALVRNQLERFRDYGVE